MDELLPSWIWPNMHRTVVEKGVLLLVSQDEQLLRKVFCCWLVKMSNCWGRCFVVDWLRCLHSLSILICLTLWDLNTLATLLSPVKLNLRMDQTTVWNVTCLVYCHCEEIFDFQKGAGSSLHCECLNAVHPQSGIPYVPLLQDTDIWRANVDNGVLGILHTLQVGLCS